MITYTDVLDSINQIAEFEQKVFDLTRQIDEKDLQYEELLMQADTEGQLKNERQRKCFVDGKKQADSEYQKLVRELETTKVQLSASNRYFQLKLKFANPEHSQI